MEKAITPQEALASKENGLHLPGFVIQAFNKLISDNLIKFEDRTGASSVFTQEEIILEIQQRSPTRITSQDIIDGCYLDIEHFYRKAGWLVEYLPAEGYPGRVARFEFAVKINTRQ